MHLHFERTVNAKSDCPILSLTWMGKVPDELPEDEGWKLNRTNYYQEGWLATGNVRGIVGVTFTTSHCKKNVDFPLRTNYNLRGHRSEVILVKWNEPYQKLASCDSSGIIFVWIKYEGRWSIELINDRNTPVTHFSWSHDGRMALICYQDGFVLVGSVAGQRYWSSMLNLEATITCGIWTPDDQQVYFGTTTGQIIVMDVHGAMVSQVQLAGEVGITSMAWSCEKFKMEEGDDNEASSGVLHSSERKFVLAVSLQNGFIYLLNTFDDVSPIQINTELQGPLCMEWSNSREYLAVSGITFNSPTVSDHIEYTNLLKFYNEKGILLYSTVIPDKHAKVSTLTWGHNDKRLFLATGTQIHIAWVSKRIASLQLLCRLRIHDLIPQEHLLSQLPLPARLRNIIGNLYAQTIRCCVPEPSALREFVSRPPIGSVRLHCTMIRHDEENNLSSGTCYTLYLEYLGGLVPLLKGKRTSKIRPEFVIFDPQSDCGTLNNDLLDSSSKSAESKSSSSNSGCLSDSSESERDEGCASPRMQRRRRRRRKEKAREQQQATTGAGSSTNEDLNEDLSYVDTLPEQVRLVEVTSNIWGTKFKIHGLATCVPANLGQVTYKTSLLHLQPRQMTLVMTELRDDFPIGPDPTFNPNLFSEDEEDGNSHQELATSVKLLTKNIDCPPIAPMSPRANVLKRLNHQYYLNHNLKNADRSEIAALVHFNGKDNTKVPQQFHNNIISSSNSSNISSTASTSSTSRLNHFQNRPDQIKSLSVPQSLLRPNNDTNNTNNSTTSTTTNNNTASVSQTSFISNFDLSYLKSSSSASNNQQGQRQAVSPICCEVVPALQSPKNAVAPSDIIFDRPPATANFFNSQYQKMPSSTHHNNSSSSTNNGYYHINNNNNNFNINNNHNTNTFVVDIANDLNSKNLKSKTSPIISNRNNKSSTFNCGDIKEFIDDTTDSTIDVVKATTSTNRIESKIDSIMVRSCSVGYLDMVELVPSDATLSLLQKDIPKRLVLVNKKCRQRKRKPHPPVDSLKDCQKLKNCGKSRSLDSDILSHLHSPANESTSKIDDGSLLKNINSTTNNTTATVALTNVENGKEQVEKKSNKSRFDLFSSPLMMRRKKKKEVPVVNESTNNGLSNLEKLITKLKDDDLENSKANSPRLPRSSPASPVPAKKGSRPQSASPIRRRLLNSPLLGRRNRKNKMQESSDDELNTASGDEIFNGTNYKDLETFQKSQLRQKLKRGKIEPNGSSCQNGPVVPQRREFVMHNKAPMWNENSQVYQLDFGGRVTQESAKNFQIEFRGKQVMQFGRIDGNAYTLDFQYPFSALQAFSVALANVTQRLK